LYETIRRTTRLLLEAARATLGVLLSGLNWVGLALVLVASALLVYLGAVLLARLGCGRSIPEAAQSVAEDLRDF